MKRAIAGVTLLLALVPCSTGQEKKTDDALTQALKGADVIFTGTIGKVSPMGQTNSIPPSTFGNMTFKDAKALKGEAKEGTSYNYSYKEGTTKNMDLQAKGQVLVAVKGKSAVVIVPATEENLALAQKILDAAKDKK